MSLSENSRSADSKRRQSSPDQRAPLGSECRLSCNIARETRRRNIMDVKVCLFGPVDHDQTQKFLKEEAAKLEEIESQRWNFDFATERPLPGVWEWEAINERDAPAFYGSFSATWKPAVVDARQAGTEFANFKTGRLSLIASSTVECVEQEDKENIENSREDCVEQSRLQKYSPDSLEASPKRKAVARPSVLDFYPARKKRSPPKSHNGSTSEEDNSRVEERSSSQ